MNFLRKIKSSHHQIYYKYICEYIKIFLPIIYVICFFFTIVSVTQNREVVSYGDFRNIDSIATITRILILIFYEINMTYSECIALCIKYK